MNCPSCSSKNVGQIGFAAIRSGVTFQYCRECEHRWWTGNGRHVRLEEVLEAAASLARAS